MQHLRSFSFFALLLMTVTALTSCGKMQEPELTAVEITQLTRTAGEGTLKVDLHYHNPNGKSLAIGKSSIDAMLNQKEIGTYEVGEDVVAGGGDKIVQIEYRFEADDIYPGFLSNQLGAIGSKRVRITLSGNMSFTGADAKKDAEPILVPVEYSEVYKIPN